jgi:uncharacterized protein
MRRREFIGITFSAAGLTISSSQLRSEQPLSVLNKRVSERGNVPAENGPHGEPGPQDSNRVHQEKRIRVLILTGQMDRYHDWRATTAFIEEFLQEAQRFDVRTLDDPRGLNAEVLRSYDVLILNYNGPRWGTDAERAVEGFVGHGKGMVAFHGVLYGPLMGTEMDVSGDFVYHPELAWPAYSKMLGAFWQPRNIGHSLPHVFWVRLTDRHHPITERMGGRFLTSDELYHRISLLPGSRVLASAFDNPAVEGTGRNEPMCWTVHYGQGRTFYTTLGHNTSAMYQPGFITLFSRAVEWAATGQVTLPAGLPPKPVNPVRVAVVDGGYQYPASFNNIWSGNGEIEAYHAASQAQVFTPDMKHRWDVLVLHDMHNQIREEEKKNLRAFLEAGKGVVCLGHAIADYGSWPWWNEEVIGGKFFVNSKSGQPASRLQSDVQLVVNPVPTMKKHPIIRGLFPLVIQDNAFTGMWHSPQITVLMETQNPLNDRPVVYLGPNPKLRAAYIQVGCTSYTDNHPGYHTLVQNAILWAAGRLV